MSNMCVGSSIDSRVVGHNSGLVLEIKDHICSDTGWWLMTSIAKTTY